MKLNPNIVKLTSLAVTNKKIKFIYKIRNNNDFELRFEENISLNFIENFTHLEDLGVLVITVEHNRVTIIVNEELSDLFYRLKDDYNTIWRR